MDTKIRIILGFLCAWFSMTAFAEALPSDSIQIAYVRRDGFMYPKVGMRLFLAGDTTVNDVDYRKCWGNFYRGDNDDLESPPILEALLREKENRVYMLNYKNDSFCYPYGFENEECLIYDFNLNEGESFEINENLLNDYSFSWKYFEVTSPIRILSVDSIEIDGTMRKVQETSEFKCIEGVGCIDSNNLPYPLHLSDWITDGSSPFYITRLYDKDNNIIYQWRDIDDGGPVNGVGTISRDSSDKISYEGGTLKIEASGTWLLRLYSVEGKQAARYKGENSSSFNIGNLPSGIYIARLTSNGVTKTLKLKR